MEGKGERQRRIGRGGKEAGTKPPMAKAGPAFRQHRICAEEWLNSAGTGWNGVSPPVSGVPPPKTVAPPRGEAVSTF